MVEKYGRVFVMCSSRLSKEKNCKILIKQFVVTPAAGKRLIAKALSEHADIKSALVSGTIVIVAGTTNGYIAEEILKSLSASDGFFRGRFFRGITLPPDQKASKFDGSSGERKFPGDVVIKDGVYLKGLTIHDVVDNLKEGDIIIKGANALDLSHKRAAILIGDPKAGTIGVALQAVVGRRVQLILPIGVEKRINGELDEIANRLNRAGSHGPRLLPVPGKVFTEIDALLLLTGAKAEIISAGGVCGAEGCVWLAVSGTPEQVRRADLIVKAISAETPFTF